MANSTIKRYNGSSWDTLEPITTGQSVYGSGTLSTTPLLDSNNSINPAFIPKYFNKRIYINDLHLPYEYVAVEYIQSSGTQYINTQYIAKNNSGIEVEYAYVSSGNAGVCGIYQSSEPRTDTLFITTNSGQTSSNVFMASRGNTVDTSVSIAIGTKYTSSINFLNDNSLKLNGTSYGSNGTNGVVSRAIILCGRDSGGSYALSSIKLYRCRISEGNVIVRDLVPCYRRSDTTIGMYDVANKVFYTNAGSGSFTKGSDVSSVNEQVALLSDIPSNEIFWATYGTTTGEEIAAAITAGKYVACKYNGNIYGNCLLHTQESRYYLTGFYGSYTRLMVRCSTTGATWGSGSTTFLGGFTVDGTSRVTSNNGTLVTMNGNYNPTSNKLATASDIPPTITVTTTSGSQSVSDGTNTLSFGSNAFNSTSIPSITTTTGSEAVGSLNVVTRDTAQTISGQKTFNANPILSNQIYIQGKDSGGTAYNIFGVNGSNNVRIGNVSLGDIFSGNTIRPDSSKSNLIDLGNSSIKWRDLYLGGSLKDGTNSVSVANIVTKDTEQTISATKTFSTSPIFNNGVDFKIKDSNGTARSILRMSTDNILRVGGYGGTRVTTSLLPNSDATYDFGVTTLRWKSVYVSGNISDGTNSISVAGIESNGNKVTSISNTSTDTQYPSAKCLYTNLKNVREVAEGKCKAVTLSYNATVDSDTFEYGSLYKLDGTEITSLTAFNSYVGDAVKKNSIFNSQSTYVSPYDDTDTYLLCNYNGNYTVVLSSEYETLFKTGDIVYVTQTEVPDRWFDGSSNFYILETTKVDLTNYATTNTAQTISGQKTFSDVLALTNGNSIKFKDSGGTLRQSLRMSTNNRLEIGYNTGINGIDLMTDAYLPNAKYLYGKNASSVSKRIIGITSSNNIFINPDATGNVTIESTVRPNTSASYDLGLSDKLWRNIYMSGSLRSANNSSYGLALPDTTSYTANKTIATTDDLPSASSLPLIIDKTSQTVSSLTFTDDEKTAMGNSNNCFIKVSYTGYTYFLRKVANTSGGIEFECVYNGAYIYRAVVSHYKSGSTYPATFYSKELSFKKLYKHRIYVEAWVGNFNMQYIRFEVLSTSGTAFSSLSNVRKGIYSATADSEDWGGDSLGTIYLESNDFTYCGYHAEEETEVYGICASYTEEDVGYFVDTVTEI